MTLMNDDLFGSMEYALKERIGKPELVMGRKQEI
jgi:hypothetical protein